MNNDASQETVAALVSPAGVGGVAVIQVVGPAAVELTSRFLRNRTNDNRPRFAADRPRLARWMDEQDRIDDVLVVVSNAHRSTPSVCISSHGSVRVAERILLCLEREGVAIKEQLPVEQLWDNLSPIEAAVMKHLPRARTKRVARWLVDQLEELPARIRSIIGLLKGRQCSSGIEDARALLETFDTANILLEGARVVILGPPNAGKSTLANRLFDRPWSIESQEPGTTRDWVQQPIAIDGVPMLLADTAGLRHATDELEARAIQHSHPVILSADFQILVLDGSAPNCAIEPAWRKQLLREGKFVVVLNKSDLFRNKPKSLDASNMDMGSVLTLSALKDEGLDKLRQAMVAALLPHAGEMPSSCVWDPDQRGDLARALDLADGDPRRAAMLLGGMFLAEPCKNSHRNGPIVS